MVADRCRLSDLSAEFYGQRRGWGRGFEGDLVSKLDYLNDGTERSRYRCHLALSDLSLTNKDFGYDISDYRDIDPLYGSMEDFKVLLREAHDRNIRIVMDLVINHTSDKHPWFIEACKSRDNPHHDWYLWHEGKKGKAPNNWFAYFDKKAWWWVDEVQKFYLSTWCRYQPEVNWRNQQLKEAMFDVMRFWLELGVDGYRIDVINWFMKDEQFRSNPFRPQLSPPDLQKHIYDRNRPETHDLCREIREVVDAFPDRFAVGEAHQIRKGCRFLLRKGGRAPPRFQFRLSLPEVGGREFPAGDREVGRTAARQGLADLHLVEPRSTQALHPVRRR